MSEPAGLQRDHRTMRAGTSSPAGVGRRLGSSRRPGGPGPVPQGAVARPAGHQARASLSVVGALTTIRYALTRRDGSPAAAEAAVPPRSVSGSRRSEGLDISVGCAQDKHCQSRLESGSRENLRGWLASRLIRPCAGWVTDRYYGNCSGCGRAADGYGTCLCVAQASHPGLESHALQLRVGDLFVQLHRSEGARFRPPARFCPPSRLPV